MKCEKCGYPCDRDEVDVGVGVIYGPWGCFNCGWSEDARYDSSDKDGAKQIETPQGFIDPCGGFRRKEGGE